MHENRAVKSFEVSGYGITVEFEDGYTAYFKAVIDAGSQQMAGLSDYILRDKEKNIVFTLQYNKSFSMVKDLIDNHNPNKSLAGLYWKTASDFIIKKSRASPMHENTWSARRVVCVFGLGHLLDVMQRKKIK